MTVIGPAIGLFRTRWTSRLVDTCTIHTVTAKGTFNTSTGLYGSDTTEQAYSGGCLIRPATQTEHDRGEEEALLADVEITIPHSETDIEPGDTVTVTTATYDQQLLGTYRVVQIRVDSWNTKRRLLCRRDLGDLTQP